MYEAPIEGGALVDARVGRLVFGQDLMAGYTRSDGVHHHLRLAESGVLVFDDPKAVCAIRASEAARGAGSRTKRA